MSVLVGLSINGVQSGSEAHEGGPVGYRLLTGGSSSAMLADKPNKATARGNRSTGWGMRGYYHRFEARIVHLSAM